MYSLIVFVLVLGYVQCFPFTATVKMSADNFKIGQDVMCEVTITNQDSEDRFLYTRGTPLEGIKSNLFLVTQNRKPVRYDALHFKRGPISKYSSGIKITSKGSVAIKVDLSSAYSFKGSSNYSVSLNTKAYFLDSESRVNELHLYSTSAKFEVLGGRGSNPKLTIAEKYRLEQAKYYVQPAVAGSRVTGTPKAVSFDGKYDSVDKSDAQDAWMNAYKSMVASPSDMDSNTAHYTLWFGSATHKDTAKGTVQSIQESMENYPYTLYFKGPDCTPGDDFAYTFFRSTTIYLCDLYLDAKDRYDFDTKFGTLVHELSHAVADTDDLEYGTESCKDLAKYIPSNAVRNADNYEYFVETLTF